MIVLRSLCRTHLACGLVVLDDIPELNPGVERRLFEAADYVFCLESFRVCDRKGVFKDHHGFLRVAKAAALSSLQQVPRQAPGKFIFRSARTKMSIERIHLPPELGDVDDQDDANKKSAAKKLSIDF